MPESFTISIPAFVGSERVAMTALLRFRVNGGKIVFWYTLVRPDDVLRSAFLACRDSIQSELSVKVINGHV